MNKLFKLLSSVALAGLLATAAHAADAQATEAKVIKVTGSAKATLPGQADAVTLTEGMTLPAGSTITTGAGEEVDIQPMAGTLTAIRANSSVSLDELSVTKNDSGVVTKQTAQIGLKSGNVVSSLDPARKSINNYGVRTPKGVAAARGTVYAVTVNVTGGTSVATMAGTVTLTPVGGGAPIIVDIGTGAILNADGTSTGGTLAELISNDPSGEMASSVSAAVETVATAVQTNTIGTSSDAAVTALAAVVKVAAQANPSEASTYTTQAVTAVTASGSAVSATGATNAAAAVTEAAVQGAVQGVIAAGGNAEAAQAVTTQVSGAATSAATASAANGGATVNTTTVLGAAAAGATTATAGTTVSTPTVTAPAPTTETPNTATPVVVPPTVSTPITPIDPTVVSPSGGQQ